MIPREVAVLIVGAGPSGLMAALLLERLGIETVIVERRAGPRRAPAAHVVNARTLEICRAAGIDAKAVGEVAKPPEDAGFVDWVTKLGGDRIGRLPFERQGDDQLEFTPTPLRNLSQNKFEPLLLDALSIEPHWNCQWESAEDDGEFVTAQILNLETEERVEIRCRYLLAADGAGSRVRKSLDIPVTGPDQLQSFVMIYFRAALRDRLGTPPSVLNFVCDPVDGGAIVVHDLDAEATFMVPYDPNVESLDDYDEERCAALVRGALEDPDLDFRIESTATWTMTAQVADRYREGRIFLVGDSAHRFPPTGGLGLNTGVQDAHNLAWKLAFVLRGRADDSLLDSYEAERKPVAQNNANQSLKNALRLIEVAVALGTTEATDEARTRMYATLDDLAARERVTSAIANQAEHFDMPGLQLGFSYAPSDAVEGARDEPRTFRPSAAPGRRVPHGWVGGIEGRSSLLDWVPLDRYLLLAGPEGGAWLTAAAEVGVSGYDDGEVNVGVGVGVGVGAEDDAVVGVNASAEILTVRQVSAGEMADIAQWLDYAGIGPSGAILVRPDQHVAWRAKSDAERSGLAAALRRSVRGVRGD